MRRIALFLLVLPLGCANQKSELRYASTGQAFIPMQLPSPSTIRTGSGAPGKDYWQQKVDHDIAVTLSVETNSLHASQTVTYTNNSPDSLTYIWFQLEQNVLRNDSVRSREGNVGERDYAGITISDLKVDGEDAFLHEYGTLARINLENELESGEEVQMTMKWSFPVSVDASLRMGYDDAYEMGPVWEFAQWIPIPCVYDDVYGWNTLPYIGRGEFYTNFGDYQVAITVPSDHLVFGSGAVVNPEEVLSDEEQARLSLAKHSAEVVQIRTSQEVEELESDGESTWKFEGKNIRTFAWATSASYIWDAASVEIQDLDGTKRSVLCQSAYPVETEEVWDEAVSYVQHAIEYYSEMLYPYPWPQMSVVRGRSGGMEYPMLVYCRGNSHKGLFNVTDHEVGHDWFPMLINTDERRHAWMDEGFNTFVNHYSLEAFYGDKPHNTDVPKYVAAKFKDDLKPINTPPDLLRSRRHHSYRKPGYGMRFLREEILGEERFDAAFKEYVRRWAFKSPRPADFYRTMEDASGTDLHWFFKGFFETTMQLDQSIFDVEQEENGNSWKVTVIINNLEDWVCPVDLQITCVDGSIHEYKLPVTIWAWSNEHKHTFDLDSKVLNVKINPSETYPDINFKNNHWHVKYGKK
ncbi:M1 family metallopeptidase [PVC group bacterium]|nr:M1 family metallopeptidase [PVC group bacterium]